MKIKKFLAMMLVACAGIFSSCEYDDDELWDSVNDLAGRVSALEALTKQMNSDLSAMQSVISAWEKNVSVTSVETLTDGYIIHFSDGTKAVIKNGKDGADGEDGKDGKDGVNAPVINVAQENGVYYWNITVDGETTWLLDDAGNKLPVSGKDGADGEDGKDGADGEDGKDGADGEDGKDGADGEDGKDGENGKDGKNGITPILKIDSDGYWMVSYDNGTTFDYVLNADDEKVNAVGPKGDKGDTGATGSSGSNGTGATGPQGPQGPKGDAGDSKFAADPVKDNGDGTITITMADGTTFIFAKGASVVYKNGTTILSSIQNIAINPDGTTPLELTYELPTLENALVEILKNENVNVTVDEANKKLTFKQISGMTGGKVVILFYNDHQTLTSVLTFASTVTGNSIDDLNTQLTNNTSKDELTVTLTTPLAGPSNIIELPNADANKERTISLSSITQNAELTITEESSADFYGKVIIEIPEGAPLVELNLDVPNGTVYVKRGNVTKVITQSGAYTTIISEGAEVEKLVVKKGHVLIENGSTVGTVERQEGGDIEEITYVFYEGEVPTGKDTDKIKHRPADLYYLLKAAKNGGNVTLTRDVTLDETLTIAAEKSVTLDLNGKTINHVKECTASYSMITNKGKLTITGSGTISFEDLGAGPTDVSWGTYLIRNEGDLVVSLDETGKLEHKGPRQFTAGNGDPIAYVIDNHSAGEIEINSGIISSPKSRTLRNFYTDGEVIINGGTFIGQVWMQQGNASGSGDHSNKIGSLTITGGEFSPAGADGSSIFLTNHSANNVKLEVTGGTFNTKIGCNDATKEGVKGSITGGKFTEDAKNKTNIALLADGYTWYQSGNDEWTVFSPETDGISNAAQMFAFADMVNNKDYFFTNKTVKLNNDVDLNDAEWTPIGSAAEDHGFMGNFDGNGKIIKNLKITSISLDADGYAYAGFFGVTEGTETNSNYIKNLTIENVDIKTEGDIVCAAIAYPYYTIVENIKVKGDIKIEGGDYTAGILAYTRRCYDAKGLYIEGNNGSSINGKSTVGGVISDIQINGGGIADYANFNASDLIVSGTKCVGGISGIISGQTLDGATVKNVSIKCEDARKGTVSGALGSKSIIKNISVNNVTGATNIIGATYDGALEVVVNGDEYDKANN